MKHLSLLFWLICAACVLSASSRAYGHGFAGARFFPATLSTDDPFVADEFSLPTVSSIVTPDNGGTRDTEVSSSLCASPRNGTSSLARRSLRSILHTARR
jgi:hypothetical protein